jgi:hypothetical protein
MTTTHGQVVRRRPTTSLPHVLRSQHPTGVGGRSPRMRPGAPDGGTPGGAPGWLVLTTVLVSALLVVGLLWLAAHMITTYSAADPRVGVAEGLTDGRGVTVVVCLTYLAVVIVTSRGLIAAPNYRILDRSLRDCLARARVLLQKQPGNASSRAAMVCIEKEIDRLGRHGEIASWVRFARAGANVVLAIPLTKLAAGWRAFHATERRIVDLVPNGDLAAYAENILAELRIVDTAAARSMEKQIVLAPTTGGKRLAIEYAHYLVHLRAEDNQEKDFEQQRIALWLTAVGLLGVALVGFGLDHRAVLLTGALGGFLAPAVGALVGRGFKSLGVVVLSPVGGAMAAVGGLLVLQLVSGSGTGVLGPALSDPWSPPGTAPTPAALALALLFGFSGRLFSQVAISATGQLTTSRPSAADPGENTPRSSATRG